MKQFLLSILSSFVLLSGIAQEQCISCYQNDVNFLKYSSAIGTYNFSYGASSLAFGNGNSVKGDYAVAMGQNNISSGLGSFAGGIACQATGDYASAFGNVVKASARSAFATGYLSEATGVFSVAMGYGAKAGGHSAIALGFRVEAFAPASFAAGRFVKSGASNAITLGSGDDITHLLFNNHASTMMIGFNSTVPTFFVSESPSGGDKTGKIGIGNITAPTAKLHIRADANEDASVLLEPTGNYYGKIMIGTSDHFIQAKSGSNMHFETERNQNFVFENGNVGIGVGTSTISNKLEVAGYANTSSGYKVGNTIVISSDRDFIGNNIEASQLKLTAGTPAMGKLLQSDRDGNATWVEQSTIDDGDWTLLGNGNICRSSGKVGIGTCDVDGDATLEVVGKIVASNFKLTSINHGEGKLLQSDATGNATWVNPDWTSNGDNIQRMTGNVGIGIAASNNYKLTVAGKIRATEVMIEHIDLWYDCVFEEDYQLTSLSEIETYIAKHKHLPDVPSEADVKSNGIELGEMNAILLKKVEELTLHLIEQQKQIDELKKGL